MNGALENLALGIHMEPRKEVIHPEDIGGHMDDEEEFMPAEDEGRQGLIIDQEDDTQEEPERVRDIHERTSGSMFVAFLRQHYLKGDIPRINFVPRDLKYVLSNYNFTEKAIMLIILKPEHPGIQKTMTRLIKDKECSKMINECFYPIGILTNSLEIRVAMKFVPIKNTPCILILRMITGKKVKVDDLIMLFGDVANPSVSIEQIHMSLASYLKKRNESGSNFAVIENRASDIDRQ